MDHKVFEFTKIRSLSFIGLFLNSPVIDLWSKNWNQCLEMEIKRAPRDILLFLNQKRNLKLVTLRNSDKFDHIEHFSNQKDGKSRIFYSLENKRMICLVSNNDI
ncbi:hypothetical protein DMUE_5779 [Dictyocoela muelleri]|nr:hypothetical protein DMUE_5779 [Dictyocoela muelleri]